HLQLVMGVVLGVACLSWSGNHALYAVIAKVLHKRTDVGLRSADRVREVKACAFDDTHGQGDKAAASTLDACVRASERISIVSPITRTSIFVRRKQSRASLGLHTTGSFSLNEVLSTIGTCVMSRNFSINL